MLGVVRYWETTKSVFAEPLLSLCLRARGQQYENLIVDFPPAHGEPNFKADARHLGRYDREAPVPVIRDTACERRHLGR